MQDFGSVKKQRYNTGSYGGTRQGGSSSMLGNVLGGVLKSGLEDLF